ncbi:MAG: single-stranded-DNA-specific exonuclease RecJ [Anaerolineaceae bacterium]|nr:single-stranded-DNA-specific exonuclease RecJ [Anaerolineaceae bacterium]
MRAYIPDRESEGYGLNGPALSTMAQAGARLVITVDCGIRAVDEVAAARAAGLDFIITDHHTPGPEMPPSSVIINPKQEGGDPAAVHLTGAGLAFRLAQALLRSARHDRMAVRLKERELLDLVALGTVADMASLADPQNRALVREGLQVINEARRPGIDALLQVAGLTPGKVTARDLAFVLGPRINAAGRLESAMLASDLLMSEDPAEAARLALRLQALNDKRRALTHAAQEDINQELAGQTSTPPLILAARENIATGIVGLVAGRLCEEWQRPVVVLARGPQESRASCRSVVDFNIIRALDQCADLLLRHGGHEQAAGFTIRNDNLPALQERLSGLAHDAGTGNPRQATLEIDAEVRACQLRPALLEELATLEPTGAGNPPPLLLLRAARVLDRRLVGRGGHHLKLRLAGDNGERLEAIGFRLGERARQLPQRVDLAFHLERNEWRGRQRLQLNLQDIRPAQAD